MSQSKTNVKPTDLNYHHDSSSKYDRDIVAVIPGHEELHRKLIEYLKKRKGGVKSILDLGTGTAITAALIAKQFSDATFTLNDFSKPMLNGAKKKLNGSSVKFLFGDYARVPIGNGYDVVVSVIGMHHQTTAGKKAMFKKIYASLAPGGCFLLGDLMTWRDARVAAVAQARHLHHLVSTASNAASLQAWAHHHLVLNDPATVEDQTEWLRNCGFTVKKLFGQWNTVLLVAEKK